jgi:hypothetical protein
VQLLIAVELTPSLSDKHQALVLRYLGEAERFSLGEWVTLLEAFTTLSGSRVWLDDEMLTFQAFHDRFVDQAYSDSLITALFDETNISTHAPTIQAGYARQIYQRLRSEPFALGGGGAAQCLLAYCLYWWASFARGCAFELEITRDLEAAGVPFAAHDLRVREQRFSPSDLTVLGMTGDIKNTTYFLHVARSFPLTCDFYITQLYDSARRSYRRIVIVTEQAWHRINGETVTGDLTRAAQLLPDIVGVTFLGYHLVVVDYEIWKQKVRDRQYVGGEPP